MTLQKKSLEDVENTFDFLLGVVALASDGDQQEIKDGAFDYAREILHAAEVSLRDIDMYDISIKALDKAELLALSEDFKAAYKVLQNCSCALMEKSGTFANTRHLLDKQKSLQ